MNQWRKPDIFTVLVMGMVLTTGCLGPTFTGAAPATPPATPIIDETVPALPTTAPAIAVTTADIPVTTPVTLALNAPAVTAEASQVPGPAPAVPMVDNSSDNKSANTYDDPLSTVSVEGITGSLLIHVGAGSGDGLTTYIVRNGTTVPPFDSSYDPYRSVVEGQNPGYLHVKILPDGNSAIVNLMPGSYLAYLPDRGGGQTEEQSFVIHPGYLTYVTFNGHAVGSSGGCGC